MVNVIFATTNKTHKPNLSSVKMLFMKTGCMCFLSVFLQKCILFLSWMWDTICLFPLIYLPDIRCSTLSATESNAYMHFECNYWHPVGCECAPGGYEITFQLNLLMHLASLMFWCDIFKQYLLRYRLVCGQCILGSPRINLEKIFSIETEFDLDLLVFSGANHILQI